MSCGLVLVSIAINLGAILRTVLRVYQVEVSDSREGDFVVYCVECVVTTVLVLHFEDDDVLDARLADALKIPLFSKRDFGVGRKFLSTKIIAKS